MVDWLNRQTLCLFGRTRLVMHLLLLADGGRGPDDLAHRRHVHLQGQLLLNLMWLTPPLLLDPEWTRSCPATILMYICQLSTRFGCGHITWSLSCIKNICLTITWVFFWVNYSRYGEKGNFAMHTGVTVWLTDSWPNGIVHTQDGLVTIGKPNLLRLDKRHNQAESDHEW
jgi:hypothetical protein